MEYKYLLFSKSPDGIVKVTINRPEVRNVLNTPARLELKQLVDEINSDPSTRVVIITGAQKSFIAGADVNYFLPLDPITADEFVRTVGQHLFTSLEQMNVPVIAMINGYCFGAGMELALCCDIRIASTAAKFGQLEINVGLIPGGGASTRLPRLIGTGRAKEMIFTGRIIDAAEAERIGLVDRVVAPEQLEAEVNQIAKTIVSKSSLLIKMAKKSINHGVYTDMAASLNYERVAFDMVFGTEDHLEGINAFLEKRQPKFKDK